MKTVVLINPNTSAETTSMMAAIASQRLSPRYHVIGRTVRNGPRMIVDERALQAAASEVVALAERLVADRVSHNAVIVSAFGDPGVDGVRRVTGVPTIGIAEAAIREAAADGRRFGIATTTPGLVASINDRVAALGFRHCYSGTRLTAGDPGTVVAKPAVLRARLIEAVQDCVRIDNASAVIIGGGPLAAAAEDLERHVDVPVIAPIPAACRAVCRILGG